MNEILALYIRLSMEDDDLGETKIYSMSVQNQWTYLWNFLMDHPEIQCGEVREFIDDGYSGTNFERPAMQEMLELVKAGIVKCIIVKDFSRFGRNYLETGTYLEQIFPCMGVRFISIDDHYDSNCNSGDVPGLDVVFKNIIHDYYSKELSAKVLQTKRNLAYKGLFMGGIPPFGYLKNPLDRHNLVVDPESAKTVRRIFLWALEGKSYGEIARLLNGEKTETPAQRLWRLGIRKSNLNEEQVHHMKWSAESVRMVLVNPAVTGSVVNHRVERKTMGRAELRPVKKTDFIIVENMHEPIIDKETFEKVQKRMKASENRRASKAAEYPLSGILKCGCCGKNLVREGRNNCYRYICKYARNEEDYRHRSIKIREEDVRSTLTSLIRLAAKLQLSGDEADKEVRTGRISAVASKIQRNTKELAELYEKYTEGLISRETFSRQKEALKACELSEKEKTDTENLQRADKPQVNFKMIAEGEDDSWLTKELVRELVQEIEVYSGMSIKIKWKCKDWFCENPVADKSLIS